MTIFHIRRILFLIADSQQQKTTHLGFEIWPFDL